jgi:hypothetical protein
LTVNDPRCARHGTMLSIDALRGFICVECDNDNDAAVFGPFIRCWQFVRRLFT